MATALSTLSVSNRDLNAFSVLSPPLSQRSSRSPITTRGLQLSGPVRVAVGKPGAPRQRRRKWQRREQAGQCGLGPARGKPGPAMISGTPGDIRHLLDVAVLEMHLPLLHGFVRRWGDTILLEIWQ